jgi:hypothetical protein
LKRYYRGTIPNEVLILSDNLEFESIEDTQINQDKESEIAIPLTEESSEADDQMNRDVEEIPCILPFFTTADIESIVKQPLFQSAINGGSNTRGTNLVQQILEEARQLWIQKGVKASKKRKVTIKDLERRFKNLFPHMVGYSMKIPPVFTYLEQHTEFNRL